VRVSEFRSPAKERGAQLPLLIAFLILVNEGRIGVVGIVSGRSIRD